jgi:RNA polymerase sigma-70 factor, ECF subfamily
MTIVAMLETAAVVSSSSGQRLPHSYFTTTRPADDFATLIIAALPMLRAFARSLCGDPVRADDLVQETVVRALANGEKFTPGTNLSAWLVTILRNHLYSEGRKRRREVEDVDDQFSSMLEDLPTQYGQLDMSDFVKALGSLPAEQRDALVLVGASGFSYEEAAEICGVRVGTIKSRVSRSRVRLLQMFAGPAGNAKVVSLSRLEA